MRASTAHSDDLRTPSNTWELTSSPEMGYGSSEAPWFPIGYIPVAVYQKIIIDAEHPVLNCCLK